VDNQWRKQASPLAGIGGSIESPSPGAGRPQLGKWNGRPSALERKDDMRKRGIASPYDGDALALTFAYPVASNDPVEECEAPTLEHWMAAQDASP
jgi:hypothetical protein